MQNINKALSLKYQKAYKCLSGISLEVCCRVNVIGYYTLLSMKEGKEHNDSDILVEYVNLYTWKYTSVMFYRPTWNKTCENVPLSCLGLSYIQQYIYWNSCFHFLSWNTVSIKSCFCKIGSVRTYLWWNL